MSWFIDIDHDYRGNPLVLVYQWDGMFGKIGYVWVFPVPGMFCAQRFPA